MAKMAFTIADVSRRNHESCPWKEKSEDDEDGNANPFLESSTFPSDKEVEYRALGLPVFDDRGPSRPNTDVNGP